MNSGDEQKALERRPIFWFYGSSSIAYGIKDNAFSYLLLTFANQALGVPGYLASLALAIAIVWDALTDPLLGHWSDKTQSKLGRRHPFMYAALFILPASFYALFNPLIDVRGEDAFWYVFILAILIRTGTTLFEVPCTALLPDLEKDYDRRNRWLALRHLFGWTGGNGLHTINVTFWVGAYGFASATGYMIYGTVGAVIIALAILISSLGTQRAAAQMPRPQEPFRFNAIGKEFGQIFESLKNRNFAALFFYSLLFGAAAGLSTALYLYITRFFFEFTGTQIGITGIAVLLAPFIAWPLAPKLGFLLGKKVTAISLQLTRLTLYPIPYICVLTGWWPALGSTASIAIYTAFIFTEVAVFIVSAVMLDSMMADVVEDSEKQTNRRSEGLFFAARSFAGKFVSASGIISAGLIITAVGFDTITTVADFTGDHRVKLAQLFLPAYCSLILGAIACISLYQIDRSTHEQNIRILNDRLLTEPSDGIELEKT
jgi:Na+/melibiose symporter-like transporter